MDVIKKVAKKHNVSSSQVRREMNLAIKAAESNPTTQEMWSKLFPNGKKPTPEEFIETIANFIKTNKKTAVDP